MGRGPSAPNSSHQWDSPVFHSSSSHQWDKAINTVRAMVNSMDNMDSKRVKDSMDNTGFHRDTANRGRSNREMGSWCNKAWKREQAW